MGLSKWVFPFLFLFFSDGVCAQEQFFWTSFKDKNNTPYSVNAPSDFLSERAVKRRDKQNIPITKHDLPVDPDYTDSLASEGAVVWYTSRWMNGAMIKADSSTVDSVHHFTFVDSVEWIAEVPDNSTNRARSLKKTDRRPASRVSGHLDYGGAANQVSMLGGHAMHRDGYAGDSMLIAVMDAGYQNAPALPAFDSLFSRNGVKGTYDFSNKDTQVYDTHGHGIKVWSVLAAYDPGKMIGIAYNADYLLFQTEEVSRESRIEEYHWLAAAEYADSAGADIINSSLGYDIFDKSSHSYSREDMDGNTTIVTRAADYAAATGMVVVNSAGNGDSVLAPADGDSVLAAGSVDKDGNYAGSALGPTADDRLKPNLAAQGDGTLVALKGGGYDNKNGTSFAAPLISGLVAGIWQQYDTLSAEALKKALYKSASQYHNPDYKVGYGIPYYPGVQNVLSTNRAGVAEENVRIFPDSEQTGKYFLEAPPELREKKAHLLIYDIAGRMIAEKDFTVRNDRTSFSFRAADRFRGSLMLMKLILADKVYYFRFPVR